MRLPAISHVYSCSLIFSQSGRSTKVKTIAGQSQGALPMNIKSSAVLAIAAVLIALPSPTIFAQSSDAEAAKMVPANAEFTSVIDSQRMQAGTQFRVKLSTKAHLDNNTDLPAGTILVGQIVADDTQSGGAAKLALRFTEADLKGGKTVLIKATIVDVYALYNDGMTTNNGVVTHPLDWNGKTAVVDQVGVLSGVDLHSKIDSPNSGVFVSTKKNDIKLTPSIGVELAIAAADGQQSASNTPQSKTTSAQ
jgi:hypothetical protein